MSNSRTGMANSISRMTLRAITASAVSRPPSRAATRRPMIRLPIVAARGDSSKAMNQPLFSRKVPRKKMMAICSVFLPPIAIQVAPMAHQNRTMAMIWMVQSITKAPIRCPASPMRRFRSMPSGVISERRSAASDRALAS
jgi:hypothetical protein